jgi:hypothetical protein
MASNAKCKYCNTELWVFTGEHILCERCIAVAQSVSVLNNADLLLLIMQGVKLQEETTTEDAAIKYKIAEKEMEMRGYNFIKLGQSRADYYGDFPTLELLLNAALK